MAFFSAVLALVLASLSDCLPVDHIRHLDWQRGTRPNGRCPPKCQPELCPDTRALQGCTSGLIRDVCGCCWECGNGEGQLCDPKPWTGVTFYGRCTEGLRCKIPRRDPTSKEEPKPVCVCAKQEMVCGSDGKTYENVCQLRATQRRLGEMMKLSVVHHGPCKARPVITYISRDIDALEGRDVLLSCEVSSYPIASIQWKKEGDSTFRAAEDSTRAIQAQGGPRRFELTGWLQIHTVGPDDAGLYTCIARNVYGEVFASSRLRVTRRVSLQDKEPSIRKNEVHRTPLSEDETEDDEDYEGQPSGNMYL